MQDGNGGDRRIFLLAGSGGILAAQVWGFSPYFQRLYGFEKLATSYNYTGGKIDKGAWAL
jgi:hypothetical protein